MTFYFFCIVFLSRRVLGVGKGLETILSHMAFTCLNKSASRAIWTHFKSNSVMFVKKLSRLGLGPGPGLFQDLGPGPEPGPDQVLVLELNSTWGYVCGTVEYANGISHV